jgi:hypothetical protein
MPPGGTKTELGVIHFAAWCLARDPHCRFLHLSGGDELALLNSGTIKEIIEIEEFQALWPTTIRSDSSAKKRWNIEVKGKTAGGVYATSTGGQVTGFRAMASSLLSEQGWSVDAIERQLAHVERNRVRAAYHRAEHLEERRRMMQGWADYLDMCHARAILGR